MNKETKLNLVAIIIILIILIIIALLTSKKEETKESNKPSTADLKAGLENTFKSIDNLKCDYYGEFNYGDKTFKYTCTFDYQLDEDSEIVKDYKTCTDCVLKDGSFTCSVGSKECFK